MPAARDGASSRPSSPPRLLSTMLAPPASNGAGSPISSGQPLQVAALMDTTETDVLAYMTFPTQHRTKLHSTDPLERLNGEIKRRTGSSASSPKEADITRLVGAILLERNDERAVRRAGHITLERIAPTGDDPIVSLPAAAPDTPGQAGIVVAPRSYITIRDTTDRPMPP